MNNNPKQRDDNLFNALKAVCGADTINEAKDLLTICERMKGVEEADQSAAALRVLIEEWPSALQETADLLGIPVHSKEAQITEALAKYHDELNARRHLDIASRCFVQRVESILEKPWVKKTPDPEKIELKSCPKCHTDIQPTIKENGIGDYYYECECGATTSEAGCETEEGAAFRWNRGYVSKDWSKEEEPE